MLKERIYGFLTEWLGRSLTDKEIAICLNEDLDEVRAALDYLHQVERRINHREDGLWAPFFDDITG